MPTLPPDLRHFTKGGAGYLADLSVGLLSVWFLAKIGLAGWLVGLVDEKARTCSVFWQFRSPSVSCWLQGLFSWLSGSRHRTYGWFS